MQEQDRIWTLVARKLAGEATDEECRELEQLLNGRPDLTYTVEMMLNLWAQEKPSDRQEAEAAFDRLQQRMAVKEVQKITRRPTSTSSRISWQKQPAKTIRLFHTLMNSGDLLNNYFKTSFRTLLRNKTFSSINIIGLAVGMAGAILLLLWIQNMFSFDQFHSKKDRIYQVYNRLEYGGNIDVWASLPHPLGPQLKATWPQVEEAVRVNWVGAFVLKYGDKQLETQGFLTDPAFLTVFDFPLLKGDARTALNATHSIVLTEEMAHKLFGKEEAMGKVIRIDSNVNFTVTGVMKKLPHNTRFDFDYLVPWNYMQEVKWENPDWTSNSIITYVLLRPGVTEETANALFANLIKNNAQGDKREIFLHPMRKWELWSRFENGKIAGGGIEVVRLLSIIAAFILLIACINYMNMSTARSEKRAKEVGIRKVAGAGRGSLIGQFICESVIIAAVAGALALFIAQSALGWFNRLTGQELFIPYTNPLFWIMAIGFIFLTGILAGSYPAFYLSAFRPVKVLKGTFKAAHSLVTPRKVLVVVQFTFAIIFIICTLIIYRQILHVQKRDTGVDMDKLAFVYVKGDIRKNYRLIKNELLSSGLATAVTRTNSPITDVWSNTSHYSWEGKANNERISFIQFLADDDFTQTMGLKVIAGRDINTRLYPTDSSALLLTELAVKRMGLRQPLGAIIKGDYRDWHVVGVINDFLPGSPFQPVQPIVLQGPDKDWFGAVSFRLKNTDAATMNKVAQVFKKYNPDYPFDYYFTADFQQRKFSGPKNTGELAAVFAGLTILISCLGLFALAAYMAESRVKEIGVRKVLGASVAALVTLLSTGFLKLVFIAFLVASPIAWWLMHSWLQHFAYRINIGWWVFGLTGIVSVLIAIATVSYQALKAALANPIKALRNE